MGQKEKEGRLFPGPCSAATGNSYTISPLSLMNCTLHVRGSAGEGPAQGPGQGPYLPRYKVELGPLQVSILGSFAFWFHVQ